MKIKNIIITLTVCLLALSINAIAQDNLAAIKTASKVAQNMADTLNLNESERLQIYNINMDLYRQEKLIMESNLPKDSIESSLQKIENKRNGLYKAILTNEKYLIYKQKKRFLLRTN